MLDLNDIALFVHVARTGSFAEAARRLGVPSNTISRRAQEREGQLGTRLLQRSTRKLTLTSAGEAFHARCADAVEVLVAVRKAAVAGLGITLFPARSPGSTFRPACSFRCCRNTGARAYGSLIAPSRIHEEFGQMRAGWNPARRNRNVGTKAHGHGSNNRLVIPESWHEVKCFYERLDSYVVVKRRVAEHDLTFMIEPTRPAWFHPCTIEDVCRALSHLPSGHVANFSLIVMRQPTRKQRVLSPVWGRAIFVFDAPDYSGAAIVLEAQNDEPLAWPISLSPERARELDRLRADGHKVQKSKRRFEISTTPDSLRNTVLYRTLLHEVGHHVDHSRRSAEEWQSLTPTEREDFAHRYAADMRKMLQGLGVLPFAQQIEDDALSQDGLRRAWFQAASR